MSTSAQQQQSGAQPGQGLTDTQQMMYAFGDSRRPNIETAQIVEQIVLSQLRSILHLATAVAAQRNSDILIVEDILFLMRKNPIKIQRLIRYLRAKDKVNELSMLEKGEPTQDRRFHSVTRCRSFLSKIDDTGVLLAACDQEYSDENYLERLMRLDRMTRVMDEKRYREFCRAREVSFKGKYSQWFQNALQEVVDTLDIKLEKLTNDVICYLAYETLGQLIELCLVVRRDYVSNTGDSLSRLQPIQAVNPAYPSISLPVREKQTTAQQQQQKKSDFVGTAITPAEVREAVRRLQAGTRVKSFASSKFPRVMSALQLEPDLPLLAI
jgi:transcription initiation protein SPT3